MQESKIEVSHKGAGIVLKLIIFLVLISSQILKFSIKEQKYKITILVNIDKNKKLDLMRKLFFLMNLLNIKTAKTTY